MPWALSRAHPSELLLWGMCGGLRPPGSTEPLVPVPSLPASLCLHQPLSVQALHSIRENYRASGVVFDRTSVNHADCGTAVRGFQPLSLQHCSKGTKNWSATAVFLHSLSLPINSRPTYFNLKTKRENLFNILSWGLSPKPSWMNLVHWSQRDCFHQLQ